MIKEYDFTPRFFIASAMFLIMIILFMSSNELRYFQNRSPNHGDYNQYSLGYITSILAINALGVFVIISIIITIIKLEEIKRVKIK